MIVCIGSSIASGVTKKTIRQGKCKAVRIRVVLANSVIELYDLSVDPGEKNNIAAQFVEKVKEMKELFMKEHVMSEVFPFAYEK